MRDFFVRSKQTKGDASLYVRLTKRTPKMELWVRVPILVDVELWRSPKSRDWSDFISSDYGFGKLNEMKKYDKMLTDALQKSQTKEELVRRVSIICPFDELDKARKREAAELEAKEVARREAEERKKRTILWYVGSFITEIEDGSRKFKGTSYSPNTIKVWNSFSLILHRFYEEHPFTWEEIDKKLADKFINFMEKEEYMVKSINKYLICFRALVGFAYEDGIHNNSAALTVFTKKRVIDEDKTREIYLTSSELEALYNMELTGLDDQIRDVFLIGCYTCQRFSDYGRLEKNNFTTTARGTKVVKLIQQKTKNMVVIPILNDNLLKIAEKYSYDIPEVSDVILNRYIKGILKELANSVPTLAELEPTMLTMKERSKEAKGEVSYQRIGGRVVKPRYELVTSHTARRSGITNLYLTGMFDDIQMMSISGHKDPKTFREYIKLSSDEIADKIADKLTQRDLF